MYADPVNRRLRTTLEDLREATGEGHTSQALDAAARHYIRCRGDIAAIPTGTYAKLLEPLATPTAESDQKSQSSVCFTRVSH